MDKNQIIGFILIFAVLLGWSVITSPSKEDIANQKRMQDSIERERLILENEAIAVIESNKQELPPQPEYSDSMVNEQLKYTFGEFAAAAAGTSSEYTLENEDIKFTFDSKGGFIKGATLNKYDKIIGGKRSPESKVPVALLEDPENVFSYQLSLKGRNQVIQTEDLYFTGNKSGNTLTFTAQGNNGKEFTQKYTLADSGYKLDYDISYAGLTDTPIKLNWVNYLDTIEKNLQFEKRYSTIYYKETNEDPDYCSCAADDEEDLSSTKLDWLSHSNQFFNTALMSTDQPFGASILETKMLEGDPNNLKLLKTQLDIPSSGSGTFNMNLYVGPNEYDRLITYGNDLDEIIPYGNSLFGTINRHFIRPFFNLLGKYIGSIGIVIIVIIFIIKMALYPLMYKMLYSQAKMGALKPELASLKEKLKDDPQKQQMETMKIYREYGVSPFGGCMPMILQMPIWYALFRFFPAAIEFRQKGFLWADDLSSYDVWFNLPTEIPMFGAHVSLFTILWAISTIIYTFYNTKHMDMSANPAMKYVQYFMPVGFLVFFNSYASALTCYMFFSNLINIAQTIITKNFVFDDEKIRKVLMKNKSKPKKKSGFGARLEDAMKKQQQVATDKKGVQGPTRKKK